MLCLFLQHSKYIDEVGVVRLFLPMCSVSLYFYKVTPHYSLIRILFVLLHHRLYPYIHCMRNVVFLAEWNQRQCDGRQTLSMLIFEPCCPISTPPPPRLPIVDMVTLATFYMFAFSAYWHFVSMCSLPTLDTWLTYLLMHINKKVLVSRTKHTAHRRRNQLMYSNRMSISKSVL